MDLTLGFIDETRDTRRLRKGISTKTGFEWSITQTRFGLTLSYRDNNGSTEILLISIILM
jgi:hypothetical protein